MTNKEELNQIKKHLDDYILLDPSRLVAVKSESFEMLKETQLIVEEEKNSMIEAVNPYKDKDGNKKTYAKEDLV